MPAAVLTASEMKKVEAWTSLNCGIPESQMIAQAGEAVFRTALRCYPGSENGKWVFICGKGHNGADALQASLIAVSRGFRTMVFQVFSEKGYSPESVYLQNALREKGLEIRFLQKAGDLQIPEDACIIIDGILGAGVSREASGLVRECIDIINSSRVPVFSIDIPSGLYTDSPEVPPHVRSAATLCLGSPKLSSMFQPSRREYGRIFFNPLCFPQEQVIDQPSGLAVFGREDALSLLPLRPSHAHKYSAGKVLVIAGSLGMHGAAVMAAAGALRSGAGLVKLAVPSGIHSTVSHHVLEIISVPVGGDRPGPSSDHFTPDHVEFLTPLVQWADSLVLGPGLGKAPETAAFLNRLVPMVSKPVVIDGDGLQAVNSGHIPAAHGENIICTPHAGEYRRMGGEYCPEAPLRHLENLKALASSRGLNILLKGPTSAFAGPEGKTIILPFGNPGLAGAGTGDVLAGVLGALRCHLGSWQAACLGAYIHGEAADLAKEETGILGMTASDLIKYISSAIRNIERERDN